MHTHTHARTHTRKLAHARHLNSSLGEERVMRYMRRYEEIRFRMTPVTKNGHFDGQYYHVS